MGALPRAPVGIRESPPGTGRYYTGCRPALRLSICEALPRAPLRTFFEKKVLRTPKNF